MAYTINKNLGVISRAVNKNFEGLGEYIDDGLSGKIDSSLIGANEGVAPLNSSGLIDSAYLPSFVDDIIEAADFASLPETGETGKIYITLDDNVTYRWSGSAYVEISSSLVLGESSSTAYRGDRGKTAYDHSQEIGNPHGTTKSDIGLGNVSDDLQLKASDLDTDGTLADNSDTKIASQKAVVTFVGASISEAATHVYLTDSATLSANDRFVEFNGASGKTITLHTFSDIPSGRRYVVEVRNFSNNDVTVDLGSSNDTLASGESVEYKIDSVGDWSTIYA